MAMTFSASWAGTKNESMYAEDRQQNVAGWTQIGTWTVGTPSLTILNPRRQLRRRTKRRLRALRRSDLPQPERGVHT
jgi:hypothetical protein